MSEEKFVICPNCGALLEKGVQFCGFCGSNVDEKKSSFSQPQQPSYSQPPPQQYGTPSQTAPAQQPIYVVGETYTQQEAESKLRLAWIFAWMTLCGSILFLILTIFFALEAKKLGSNSPRIKQSIIIAIIGFVLATAIQLGLYIWFISSSFPFYYL